MHRRRFYFLRGETVDFQRWWPAHCLGWLLALMILCGQALSAASGSTTVVPTPAAASGSDSPSFSTAADGTLWLSWIEPHGDDAIQFRAAIFNPLSNGWNEPHTIANQTHWTANVFDAPRVWALSSTRAIAVWSGAISSEDGNVGSPQAYTSSTNDGGKSWSPPEHLSRDSSFVEYPRVVVLPGGQVLGVWIDSRNRNSDATAPRLYSRLLDFDLHDTLVDSSVCDCCVPSLTIAPSGDAILAYRGRSAAQIRDIQVMRFNQGAWSSERTSTRDNWKIDGCPVNGPAIISARSFNWLVWFSAGGAGKSVYLAQVEAGGHELVQKRRIDLGAPDGRVDIAVAPDGGGVVSWLESPSGGAGVAPGLYFRRIDNRGAVGAAVYAGPIVNDAVGRVFPKIAVIPSPSKRALVVLATYAKPGSPVNIETIRTELPD